jgi:hypothetical protein
VLDVAAREGRKHLEEPDGHHDRVPSPTGDLSQGVRVRRRRRRWTTAALVRRVCGEKERGRA